MLEKTARPIVEDVVTKLGGPSGTGSLRLSFMVVVATVYAFASAAGFAAFFLGARSITDRYAARYAAAQGALDRNRILSLVERELALSLKLADDPAVREWMEDEADPRLWGAAYAQLESYRRFLRDGAYFVAVKSSGSYYARTPDTSAVMRTTLDPDREADAWFFRALAEGNDYSLNVDHNEMLGENRVWINVLVRGSGGEPIGIAGCGMDVTAFLAALFDGAEPGVSTIIVDRDGYLQAYRDQRIIEYNAEVRRQGDRVTVYDLLGSDADRADFRDRLAASAENGQTDAVPAVFPLVIGGERLLCALGAISGLGWYHLVLLDVARIIGPADFLPVGAASLFSLIAVLIGVLAAMDRQVVRPLRALTEAAGTMAAGAYEITLPESDRNEIGALSASFNRMAVKVRDYTAGLEAMVHERTRELSEANGRILDSIRYARMIQDTLRPNGALLDSHLSERIVLLRQRDLVGGDFVFFAETPDGFCAAVVDCTGHGVPGALMTMMANALLHRVVEQAGQDGPAAMLAALHALTRETLKSGGAEEHFDNGMDIALVRYRRSIGQVAFAGAGLPLYAVTPEGAVEYSGSRGGLGYASMPPDRAWNEIRLPASADTMFFLVSDGVLDLGGGERGFGFGRERLRALLSRTVEAERSVRESFVAAALDEYRGVRPYRDDMAFFGYRIKDGGER